MREKIKRFSKSPWTLALMPVLFGTMLTANMGTYPDRVPIILDDYGIRKITPHECLALQGFPKDFKFPEIPLNSAYKQCGNSVVVPVIRRIAKNIMKVMSEKHE